MERAQDTTSEFINGSKGSDLRDKNGRETTAPRIPAWSPTVVLTGRHPG